MAGEQFDVITALEVLEHVEGPQAFIAMLGKCLKPGGLIFLATIDRTLKSYLLAIIGAEYVLGWVPKGTHQWEKFITPAELEDAMEDAGISAGARSGVVFHPLLNKWSMSRNADINYMLCGRRS